VYKTGVAVLLHGQAMHRPAFHIHCQRRNVWQLLVCRFTCLMGSVNCGTKHQTFTGSTLLTPLITATACNTFQNYSVFAAAALTCTNQPA
jgi:hypothetical protein